MRTTLPGSRFWSNQLHDFKTRGTGSDNNRPATSPCMQVHSRFRHAPNTIQSESAPPENATSPRGSERRSTAPENHLHCGDRARDGVGVILTSFVIISLGPWSGDEATISLILKP
jgi:hypothetical protein